MVLREATKKNVVGPFSLITELFVDVWTCLAWYSLRISKYDSFRMLASRYESAILFNYCIILVSNDFNALLNLHNKYIWFPSPNT